MGLPHQEHAMSQKQNTTIAVIGIDIGKNSFHVVGHDRRGAVVLRQKWSRGQIEARLANLPPCLVGMEACVGAHHLSRRLKALGHDARLMPAKYVRPYAKGQKNDFNDAEAIAEAVQRPTMKFVATKTADQLDLQALHRVRERLVSQRTGIINQIRAFMLERGIAVRQGVRFLRTELPIILATRTDTLSPRMLHVIEDLAGDWRRLDERVENLSSEIEAIARHDSGCDRLMSVPGIGPIISSAVVAAIGSGDVFSKGRDFAAWLGLVPKQILDGRSHDPGQNLETRKSLSARAVRASSVGRPRQADELGTSRAQVVDRGRKEAAAPQRAGDRTRQQARAHRLGGTRQGTRLRSDEDGQWFDPTCMILAPRSAPSRPSSASGPGGPALTVPARVAYRESGRDEGTVVSTNQGTDEMMSRR
jgi:transposase